MRITQSTQIRVPEVKLNKGSISSMNKGDVFRAKVIAIHTEAILLKLSDGSNLRAQVGNTERFVEGESMDFLVKENASGDSAVLVDVLVKEEVPTAVKNVLIATGLNESEKNVQAYKVLQDLGIEITKDSIEKVVKNTNFVSKIVDAVVILSDKTVSAETSTLEVTDASVEVNDEIKPLKGELLKENLLNQLSKELNIKNTDVLKQMPLKEIVLKLLDNNADTNIDIKLVENELKEVIKSTLGILVETPLAGEDKTNEANPKINVTNTMDKVGFLLKTNKSINIGNLLSVDKLIFEEKQIAEQVENIKETVKNIPDFKGKNTMLNLLKGFEIQEFKSDQGVKDYFNQLLNGLNEVDKSNFSEDLRAEVKSLTESIQFIETDSNDITWIQIPLNLNKKNTNLDIFIKNEGKHSKKINKDKTKILIALNTEYLDLFQTLIQIKDKVLEVDMKVSSAQIKSVVDGKVHILRSLLETEGFEKIKISTNVRNNITLTEFISDGVVPGHINIKV